MKNRATADYLPTFFRHLSALILLSAALAGGAVAQTTSRPTDGSTPLGLSAGAPARSFALSGFDNINLYNRSLHFPLPHLPIGGGAGRGPPPPPPPPRPPGGGGPPHRG